MWCRADLKHSLIWCNVWNLTRVLLDPKNNHVIVGRVKVCVQPKNDFLTSVNVGDVYAAIYMVSFTSSVSNNEINRSQTSARVLALLKKPLDSVIGYYDSSFHSWRLKWIYGTKQREEASYEIYYRNGIPQTNTINPAVFYWIPAAVCGWGAFQTDAFTDTTEQKRVRPRLWSIANTPV